MNKVWQKSLRSRSPNHNYQNLNSISLHRFYSSRLLGRVNLQGVYRGNNSCLCLPDNSNQSSVGYNYMKIVYTDWKNIVSSEISRLSWEFQKYFSEAYLGINNKYIELKKTIKFLCQFLLKSIRIQIWSKSR